MVKKLYSKESVILLLTAGIGFAAFNTGNNVQWLMFSIPCSAVIIAIISNIINLRKIEIEILDTKDVFAYQKALIPIQIINKSKIKNSYNLFLTLHFHSNVEIEDVFVGRLSKNDRKIILVEAKFLKRGINKCFYVKILSSFPFDLFKHSKRIYVSNDILVFPKIIEADVHIKNYFENSNQRANYKRGKGAEILNLMEYTGKEPIRNIHWKLYAKTDEIWVKDFADEESAEMIIYLNWEMIPPYKREEAISIATGMILKLYELKHSWRLISTNFDSDYGNNILHLRKCLTYLALIKDFSSADKNIATRYIGNVNARKINIANLVSNL